MSYIRNGGTLAVRKRFRALHDRSKWTQTGTLRSAVELWRPHHTIIVRTYIARGPSPSTTAWQRSAVKVQDTNLENAYLDTIRATHDPALHIKTLEDELQATIGQALGRQGHKLLVALREMATTRCSYEQARPTKQCTFSLARTYNAHRQRALHARWELMVHRQAAGMLVGNNEFVHKIYPIGPPLPTAAEDMEKDSSYSAPATATAEPYDQRGQLDWWQRVGRWK